MTDTFRIASGALDVEGLAEGQYFRVEGSIFNDGLHRYGAADMADETFTGRIWPLAIPRAVIDLSEEVARWCEENPPTDFVSESFGGYTYSRGSGTNARVGGWAAAFASRLNAWRKV